MDANNEVATAELFAWRYRAMPADDAARRVCKIEYPWDVSGVTLLRLASDDALGRGHSPTREHTQHTHGGGTLASACVHVHARGAGDN